jgi:diguanylate cyclase (GGDEF)-like protein
LWGDWGLSGRRVESKELPSAAEEKSPETATPAPAKSVHAASQDLAVAILRGIEHFVATTPDLDSAGFLSRVRASAASITPTVDAPTLDVHRRILAEAVPAFGQRQRRYFVDREEEFWRLLGLYQEQHRNASEASTLFQESIRDVYSRLGGLVRLDDLRQVRERLEGELAAAEQLIIQKDRLDTERARVLAEQVRHLEGALARARDEGNRDPLTGVFHRGAFELKLGEMLAHGTFCSVALIDLDDFKRVNDNQGHLVGDELLRATVRLLVGIAQPEDLVARFGGDEFCLLAPGTRATQLARRLEPVAEYQELELMVDVEPVTVSLSLSAGVAELRSGDTLHSLLSRADSALIAMKRGGKGQTAIS